ncbi:hypothetical protein GC197_02625 [bacterium]|nr:hypothetical protein [bacterium]
MPNDISRLSGMNIDRLSQFQKSMDDGTHVSSSVTKTVYAKPNSGSNPMQHKETSFRGRSALADAKRDIFSTLKGYIGKKAAQQLFDKHGIRRFDSGGRKFWKTSINDKAITKETLGKVLQDAKAEKLKQLLQGMSPEKREQFSQMATTMNPSEIMSHPELGPLFQMFTETEFSSENLSFMTMCNDYKQLLDDYSQLEQRLTGGDGQINDPQGLLTAKRDEIRELGSKIKTIADSGDINLASASRSKMRKMTRRNPIENMEINDLRRLYTGDDKNDKTSGPIGSMNSDVTANARDSKVRFSNSFIENQTNLSTENMGLAGLKTLATRMGSDEHLRVKNNTLYTKVSHGPQRDGVMNHSKTHFWQTMFNTNRAKKFDAAKQMVLQTLTEATGDREAATKIMKPFLNSTRALTKTDLTRIVKAADTFNTMKGKVDTLISSQSPHVPQMNVLTRETDPTNDQRNDEVGWSTAFSDYCDYKGSTAFKQAQSISDLRFVMEELRSGSRNMPLDVTTQKMNNAKSLARQILRRSDVPKGLQGQLNSILTMEAPPTTDTAIRQFQSTLMSLAQFRAETTAPKTELGKLREEFAQFVEQTSEEAKKQVLQSQVMPSEVSFAPLKGPGIRTEDLTGKQDVEVSDDVSISSDVPNWDELESTQVDQNQLRSELADLLDSQFQLSNAGVPRDSQAFAKALDQFAGLFQSLPNPQNRSEFKKLFEGLLETSVGSSILQQAAMDYNMDQGSEVMSDNSDNDVINEMNTPMGNQVEINLPPQPTIQFGQFQSVYEGDMAITRYLDDNASSGIEISKDQHQSIQNKISEAEIAQARGQTSLALDLIQEAFSMAVHAVSLAINPEVDDRIAPDGTVLPQSKTPGNDD